MNDHTYHTIAFYNLENLFDTIDDPKTNDDDFTPHSDRRWTPRRYKKKIRKLGYAISKIGRQSSQKAPVILGFAEVENKSVIQDIINSKFLVNEDYGIVHYDSPDERGIDTALIYKKEYFKVLSSEVFPMSLIDEFGLQDHTRDILYVSGMLGNEPIHILVNHWPSRREGVELTDPKRMTTAKKVVEIIHLIRSKETNPKIIVMGDFNDGPKSNSVTFMTQAAQLFNPMEQLMSYVRGSLNHQLNWILFDQIMFSTNFFKYTENGLQFSKADIFDEEFLKQFKGKYKGSPFRTYVGLKYKGGYSDHFPVYMVLKS